MSFSDPSPPTVENADGWSDGTRLDLRHVSSMDTTCLSELLLGETSRLPQISDPLAESLLNP